MATVNRKKLPRGLRNCNPLNIRFSHNNHWLGQVGHDGAFCVFKDVKHGLRAAFKLLQTYQRKYDCHRLEQFIQRWAPPKENNTQAYIERVCQYGIFAGINPKMLCVFGHKNFKEYACVIVAGMANVELGGDYISSGVINEAYDLAFQDGWVEIEKRKVNHV